MYSGWLTMSNSSTCWTGVWLVDSLHGSDSTCNTHISSMRYWLYWGIDADLDRLLRVRWQMTETRNLFQERRLHSKVFGHHVEAKQVSVDASSSHSHAVQLLVLFWRCTEQTPAHIWCLEEKGMNGTHLNGRRYLWCGCNAVYILLWFTVINLPQKCHRTSDKNDEKKVTVVRFSPLHPPALGQRHCSHCYRSERSQSCPPWTDGSWRLHRSNRKSPGPEMQRQLICYRLYWTNVTF